MSETRGESGMAQQSRFVELLVESGALLSGEFKLKNGKISPYFIDFGALPDGRHLDQLGEQFAEAIVDSVGLDGFDVVFGPAYKAIPIAVATAIAISHKYAVSKRYAFNRKVPKAYGEARQLLGGTIRHEDRVVIVDDVFTDGGAKLETIELLRDGPDPDVVGVIVGVDRSEPGALERFDRASGGVPVRSICTMDDIRAFFPVAADADHTRSVHRR
jgi:orotate phosphoribosyltransferase